MGKGEKPVPEIVRAAQALEAELSSLEALSRSVRKIRLDSDRNIGRASRELNEAVAVPERLAEGLRAMTQAMISMQTRQQAALEPLAAAAASIQQRMQRLGEHMQSFAELGQGAAEVTAFLQTATEEGGPPLGEAKARLGMLAERARGLFDAARTDDFPEVAKEADSLRQRVQSVKRKLEGDA